jgi:hypothetical protein
LLGNRRSSKPAIGIFDVNGAFDSHTLPPFVFGNLPRAKICLFVCAAQNAGLTVMKT